MASDRVIEIIKELDTHLVGERNLHLSMNLGWLKSLQGLLKCLKYMPTSTKSADMYRLARSYVLFSFLSFYTLASVLILFCEPCLLRHAIKSKSFSTS